MIKLRRGALLLSLAATTAFAALPPYTGPYGVGLIDLEVPVQSRNISNETLKATGKPAFELDTVLFTLFYPCDKNANSSLPAFSWVPKPSDLVAQGFAAFAAASGSSGGITADQIALGLNTIVGSLTIPAQVDVPLLSGNASFPVMIFSHGDAGTRTFYSHYLGELASRGVIAAAIEHRDGSGPGTAIETKAGILRNVTYFNSSAVTPTLSQEDFKFAQRAFRQAEVEETYNALRNISNGGGQALYSTNPRTGGSSLSGWSNRLNFSDFLVAGHSFGATLVTQLLEANASSSIPATAAVALDPGKDSGPLNTNVTVPILIADSESWTSQPSQFYGQPHFDVVKSIAQSSLNATNEGWFVTLLGASHATITDAALISPYVVSFFDTGFNATINATDGLAQYVKVTNQFLTVLKGGAKGDILGAGVTDSAYNVSTMNSGVSAEVARYWQIYVAPASNSSGNATSTGSGSGTTTSSGSPSASSTRASAAAITSVATWGWMIMVGAALTLFL